MKKLFFVILSLSLTISGFSQTKKVKSSTITWVGKKVTGSHDGTVKLQSGQLTFNKGKLTGGVFVIDMKSIVVTDLDGEYKTKLENHLKSDDFFGVEKHPTARLVFRKIKAVGKNQFDVTANLTIKGVTKPISFRLNMDGNKASTKLDINRTEYNIRYGSGKFFDNLGDKMIYDNFEVNVEFTI